MAVTVKTAILRSGKFGTLYEHGEYEVFAGFYGKG